MANFIYDNARASFLGVSPAINWTTDNIKLRLVMATYSAVQATDQFLSDQSGAITTNTVTNGTSGNFTGTTGTLGVANAANVTLSAVTGSAVTQIIIYKDSGVAGTSPLIAHIDSATGLPVTPNGGTITVQWDTGANKIFKL